jgi:hypothetical protein
VESLAATVGVITVDRNWAVQCKVREELSTSAAGKHVFLLVSLPNEDWHVLERCN